MAYKAIITLLVCAVVMPGAVRSAPSQSKQEVAPHRTEDVLAVTNPFPSTVRQSNEPEPIELSAGGLSESKPSRTKRAIIFRPLFVYRQQEIKKQKLKEMRQQNQQQQQQNQQSAACAACRQQQASRKPVQYYAQNYPYQRS